MSPMSTHQNRDMYELAPYGGVDLSSHNHTISPRNWTSVPLSTPSHEPIEAPSRAGRGPRYQFNRYIPPSILNTIGPILVLIFYIFIVIEYLQRPTEHGIIPSRTMDANTLMWHADQAWSSLSGWFRVLGLGAQYLGPAPLWFYLALSRFIFYVTVPLSGLSMNADNALRLSRRQAVITGVNQSTFDARAPKDLAETADGRWRQGNPTSPYGETVFYAPEETSNDIYQPWDFLTDMSCTPVNPYTGFELLDIKATNNWTVKDAYIDSNSYGNSGRALYQAQQTEATKRCSSINEIFGINYQYAMTTNADPLTGGAVHSPPSELPVDGTLELAMWQSYVESSPDETFKKMSDLPYVVSSRSIYDNATYLGYGIRCKTTTNTGPAKLSASFSTVSSFEQEAPIANSIFSSGVAQVTAFTTMSLASVGGTKCLLGGTMACNGWVGANKATNGVLLYKLNTSSYQYPTIGPERMALALSKLFGEAATVVMGRGPVNWTFSPNATSTLGLFGLEPANDLVPGYVPHIVVLILLSLWVLVAVVPQLWPSFFYERRWGEVLDGFAMLRLGAEWKEEVNGLESEDFWAKGTTVFKSIPGMIGDKNASGDEDVGFVGLSHHQAETSRRRLYTYRSSCKKGENR
ncbi:hypothetical protein F5Y18DRAFT_439332 [Xylariaceae sp. FL1019]|nr:hypothetical protein F5Y18DRAFT_439332 [Xylariaceae sp. FL1019]